MAGVGRKARAIQLHPDDNVATLVATCEAGDSVRIEGPSTPTSAVREVVAASRIPAGHKIAIAQIEAGEHVLKYGVTIGRATKPIMIGALAHTENIASTFSPVERKRLSADIDQSFYLITHRRLRAAIDQVLAMRSVPPAPAEALADHILEAHLRGVETHGLRRLKPYLARIEAGGINAATQPVIEAEAAIIRVDGQNGIGHYTARLAADAACSRARQHGIAIALVRNSSHFGFAGYYATRIAAQGMVGLAISNGQALLGPDGAKRAIFSNNPIALAAPLGEEEFFEFDIATSVTSRAKIAMAAEQGEAIPEGMALDQNGNPTTDARAAMKGILLPLGGAKGLAFVAALELLTGVLPGGCYADQVASKEADASAHEGACHFLMAIDIDRALERETFVSRLRDLVTRLRNLPMREGAEAPRYPGQRRWELRRMRLEHGIPLSRNDATSLAHLLGEDRETFLPGISA